MTNETPIEVVEEEDLSSPIWTAVQEAEKRFYTRREIAAALREVADSIEPEHGA